MNRYLVEVTVNVPDDYNRQPDLMLSVVARNEREARREASAVARRAFYARSKAAGRRAVRLGYSVQVVGKLDVEV